MANTKRGNGLGGLVRNLLISRTAWLNKLLDPRRDIDAECGHPETLTVDDYARAYDRGDVARRIVNIYPEESWNQSPEVFENEDEDETEFEKAWDQLENDFKIWHYLQRVDMLSGIGRFGVLLIGIDDGKELREPIDGVNNQLLFLRPFEEVYVTINTLNTDSTSPRFGLPELYSIQFADTALGTTPSARDASTSTSKTVNDGAQLTVHWSRVLHVADNRQNSDVLGRPRMEVVFNRLLDLKKIAGGSGEMFWKGGFPGISLEAANPDDDVTFDAEATNEQMDKYMNGLQRYIALVGMSAKSLAPQVADPRPGIETQLKLIATAIGVPWRIFIGSEQGQLAADADSVSWAKRVGRRREEYLSPFVIEALVKRFIEIGILPEPQEIIVKWPDIHTPSDEEKAIVAEKRTNALSKYVQSGVDALVPPFHFLTLVLDFSDDEANAIIEEAGDRLDELTPEFEDERAEAKASNDQARKVEQAAAAGEAMAKAPNAAPKPGQGAVSRQPAGTSPGNRA